MLWPGVVLAIAAAAPAKAADAPVAPPPAPAPRLLPVLEVAPPQGLDQDLELALADAQRALEEHRSPAAIDGLLRLFSAENRFLAAQRELLAQRAVPLLRQAGKMEAEGGRWPSAAQAYDAAWLLSGKREDPDYARVLVRWAEEHRGVDATQALWLARRARRADPAYDRAAALDRLWSHNQLAVPGVAMMGLGLGSLATSVVLSRFAQGAREELSSTVHTRQAADGLVAQQRGLGAGATVTLVAAPVLFYSGLFTLLAGNPRGPPQSPPQLPALQEASR